MSNKYIDEALHDAACLSEFQELYAYIHERESKLLVEGIANQIIVEPQFLQDYMKDNDDKLDVKPPPPTPMTPISAVAEVITIPLYALLHNPFFHIISMMEGLNSLNQEIKQYVILDCILGRVLWGDDGDHKQNIIGQISEKGFYIGSSIGSVDQITSIKGNTHIAVAGVYYTDYELLKRTVSDVNGDGKINIVDDQYVNSIIDGMKSMLWVQDIVQKQREMICDGEQPYDQSQTVNGNDTSDVVVNQGFGYYPTDLCDFSGSYLIDPHLQESNWNNITSN
ncbi:MAG: hypothetical protein EZS28_001996 [Streblomastix strix]|uniref:Dockerin domain-containing protein n=1 Tax=Streblomastix strix TaxID=222440 RepID=A0A5J4X640_9EUKA|nr:MAG: hypothetical protein EZS28_001996 [Streblomastix strix]